MSQVASVLAQALSRNPAESERAAAHPHHHDLTTQAHAANLAAGVSSDAEIGSVPAVTGHAALDACFAAHFAKRRLAAADPLRIIDFTLAQALAGLDPPTFEFLSNLRTSAPPPLAGGWCVYLETPLARLFERRPGQGGFAHGMGAMLALPAIGLAEFRAAECSVLDADAATVIGVSLPDAAATGKPALPAIYGYDAARLETDWRPPRARQAQAMALPVLLPGWRALPGQGLHAGWQALLADEDSAEPSLVGWIAEVARQYRLALWAQTTRAVQAAPDGARAADRLVALAASLHAAEVALAGHIVRIFVSHLDAVVAQGCMARRGALRPAEYNWVAAGANARTWQWRMEAMEIFPGLCTAAVVPALPIAVPAGLTRRSPVLRRLKLWAEDPAVRGAYTLCGAVDQGLPLIRHLARTFSVKPATIRALRGVDARETTLLQSPPLGWPDLLRTLDTIAPERHPRSPTAWQGFALLYTEGFHAWRVVHALNIGLGQRFIVDVMRPWLARVGRDWDAEATRWRDGFQRVDGLHAAAALGQDLKALVVSPRITARRRERLVDDLSRAPPPLWQRMVEEREAWQPPQRLHPPVLADDAPVWLWGNGCDVELLRQHAGPWHCIDAEGALGEVGLLVTPLHSMGRLRQETALMQHCIHTYTGQLASLPQLAFAVGEDGTADRSTVLLGYLRRADGNWHVRVIQHKAARNRPASRTCDAAVRRLVQGLMAPQARDAMDRTEHMRVQRLEALLAAGRRVLNPRLARPRAEAARQAERIAAQAEAVDRALHVLARVRMLRGD